MLERNLAATEFFAFIKEITHAVEGPELTTENCPNGFYKDFDQMPEDVRSIFRRSIDIQQKIIFDLLQRNIDPKFISEMI